MTNIIRISASKLKNNAAEVLNTVYFGKKTAVVERYGKIIAKIVPVDKKEKTKNTASLLNKYFGSLPDFPDVSRTRVFRKRNIDL